MTAALSKNSPLYGIYLREQPALEPMDGWQMPRHFGDPEAEARCLHDGALLVDWSHIGKISFRGDGAPRELARIDARAPDLPAGRSLRLDGMAVLRLTRDEFLVLSKPGRQGEVTAAADPEAVSILDQTGAMGCLVLAGPRRDEVMERSSAMDLRRDRVGDYSVIQTTVHVVPVMLYRMPAYDMLLTTRDYTEFLFDALMDVGRGVGLRPGGLAALAVDLGESA